MATASDTYRRPKRPYAVCMETRWLSIVSGFSHFEDSIERSIVTKVLRFPPF